MLINSCVAMQFIWTQFVFSLRRCVCRSMPLILFPVPLAVRWYLRSLALIIVCLCPPAQIPPLLFRFKLPPSYLLWHSHSHTSTWARALTQTRIPRTSPQVLALSHSLRYSIHALTPTWSRGGGVGYICLRRGHEQQTGPTCSAKTTSKKTPKPGVEVPTFILELREKRQARTQRLVLRTVCWSSDTTNLSLRCTPVFSGYSS